MILHKGDLMNSWPETFGTEIYFLLIHKYLNLNEEYQMILNPDFSWNLKGKVYNFFLRACFAVISFLAFRNGKH